MKNVEMTVEGNILTIKVELTKEFGPSSSGKTINHCLYRRKRAAPRPRRGQSGAECVQEVILVGLPAAGILMNFLLSASIGVIPY